MTIVFDGVGGEVKSKLVSKAGGEEYDIGCGNGFAKPAEEGEEEVASKGPEVST